MNLKQQILLAICLFLTLTIQAQELMVKSMKALPRDTSACTYSRMDLTGKPCALVKVQLATAGATFEGNYIPPVEYNSGEYWVYMSEGSYELRIKHPSFVPLHVNFRDYGIRDVQSLTTYDLTLIMPQAAVTQTQKLIINYIPANAIVLVDSKTYTGNGRVELTLPVGSHDYQIVAAGYNPAEGSVKLYANAPRTITENLTASTPTQAQLPTTALQSSSVMAQGAISSPGEDEFRYGERYYYGRNGTKVDYPKALKYYRKAADKGYTAAFCQLGEMYESGKGAAKDLNEAEKWYKKALEEDPFDETVQKYLTNLQKKKAELQKFSSNNIGSKQQPKLQELKVKSLTQDVSDITPLRSQYERNDIMNQPCALLKIQMTDELDRVEGNNIGKPVKRLHETWVYMLDGSKAVKLYPKAHLPLYISFPNYGINSLKSKCTYLLILTE